MPTYILKYNWKFNSIPGQIQERAEVQDELLLRRIGWKTEVLWHVNIKTIFLYCEYFYFANNCRDCRIWRKSKTVRKVKRDGGRRNSGSCLNQKDEWGTYFCCCLLTLVLVSLWRPRPRKAGCLCRVLLTRTLDKKVASIWWQNFEPSGRVAGRHVPHLKVAREYSLVSTLAF